MNTKKLMTIVGITLSALLIITAVVWTLVTRERPKTPHFAELIDYSDSRVINCAAIETTMRGILASPHLTSDSRLYLFSTGDDKSFDEPVLLDKYKIPSSVKVLEGQTKAAREIQEVINQIKTRCEQEPVKKRSPILLGIKRVIENLRAAGCDARAGCQVFVQTDGQELSETTLKQLLSADNKANANSNPRILIANEGIKIKICGFAQVGGTAATTANQKNRHNLQTAEQTSAVWKQVFTEPQLVTFTPHCQ